MYMCNMRVCDALNLLFILVEASKWEESQQRYYTV